MKIGFITCSPEKLKHYFPTAAEPYFYPTNPFYTPDDQLLIDALTQRGHHIHPIVWGQSMNALKGYDLMIIRSPWDYMDDDHNKLKFKNWILQLEKEGLPVTNPPSFVLWLLDKHYLQDLAHAGIKTIPTCYYEKNTPIHLPDLFAKMGELILKPCISAAGVGLFYIKTGDEALKYQAEVAKQLQQQSYMIQPLIREIETHGEWSLIFIAGQYSHAIHKKPSKGSIFVHAERGGTLTFQAAPHHIIHFAKSIQEQVFSIFQNKTKKSFNRDLISYLRLDVIDTARGPLLIECEGVEPELFFRACTKSIELFCDWIDCIGC